jgi:hypothetical protein
MGQRTPVCWLTSGFTIFFQSILKCSGKSRSDHVTRSRLFHQTNTTKRTIYHTMELRLKFLVTLPATLLFQQGFNLCRRLHRHVTGFLSGDIQYPLQPAKDVRVPFVSQPAYDPG